jgi:hypothetical protein
MPTIVIPCVKILERGIDLICPHRKNRKKRNFKMDANSGDIRKDGKSNVPFLAP